jgi:hypothetical protein
MAVADELNQLSGYESIERDFALLRRDKIALIRPLAFLQSSLEPGVSEKLESSYSGHAVIGQIEVSAQHLVLTINRFWDGKPARPLSVLSSVREISDEIEQIRLKSHPDWENASLQIGTLKDSITQTLDESSDFHASPEFANLRVFRTEKLSHSVHGESRDRRKFKMNGAELKLTYSDVISAARKTITVFDKICSHWKFHIENSFDTLNLETGYSRMFWRALGKLSEVEDESLIYQRDENQSSL